MPDVRYDASNLATRIGSGASCDVFLGTLLPSGEQVAVKLLDKLTTNPKRRAVLAEDIEGARTEAALLKQLQDCSHIVRLVGFLEDDKKAVTVLELVSGGDLLTAMEQGYREDDVKRLFAQILVALSACHELGIAHRDIKPENILLSRPRTDARVVVVDLGFAKMRSKGLRGRFTSNLGSPMYKAPEIWDRDVRARGYDGAASDMWSAGVLLFLMLSGQFPFRCQPAMKAFKSARDYARMQRKLLRTAVLAGDVHFDEAVWADVSPAGRALVSSLLRTDVRKALRGPMLA
ncbi:hypothetical protein FNF28_07469 [Cafeteria roenbergensis]|nr:hypothetical protein FNF28_07469 [Cafeteria roenbergensis]